MATSTTVNIRNPSVADSSTISRNNVKQIAGFIIGTIVVILAVVFAMKAFEKGTDTTSNAPYANSAAKTAPVQETAPAAGTNESNGVSNMGQDTQPQAPSTNDSGQHDSNP